MEMHSYHFLPFLCGGMDSKTESISVSNLKESCLALRFRFEGCTLFSSLSSESTSEIITSSELSLCSPMYLP